MFFLISLCNVSIFCIFLTRLFSPSHPSSSTFILFFFPFLIFVPALLLICFFQPYPLLVNFLSFSAKFLFFLNSQVIFSKKGLLDFNTAMKRFMYLGYLHTIMINIKKMYSSIVLCQKIQMKWSYSDFFCR